MLLPLAGLVVLVYFSGIMGGKPAAKPPSTPALSASGVVSLATPAELGEIIDSLGESQWGQETLDRAELLRQSYLLEAEDEGYRAAAEYLQLLLAPTHPDAVEQSLLEQVAVFLDDTSPQAIENYRTALETIYWELGKGTD